MGVAAITWELVTLSRVFIGGIGSLIAELLIIYLLSCAVFGPGEITRHRVFGAVALYLTLGMELASAYQLSWELVPNSLGNVASDVPLSQQYSTMLYFSFVTLTSVGMATSCRCSRLCVHWPIWRRSSASFTRRRCWRAWSRWNLRGVDANPRSESPRPHERRARPVDFYRAEFFRIPGGCDCQPGDRRNRQLSFCGAGHELLEKPGSRSAARSDARNTGWLKEPQCPGATRSRDECCGEILREVPCGEKSTCQCRIRASCAIGSPRSREAPGGGSAAPRPA